MGYLIPFATPGVAGTGLFENVSIPTYQSPFDSAPATTCPLAAITNFNVQVAGENVFQQNLQYDYEEFLTEVSSANAINGNCTTGLTSGLIGQYEWDNAYRYYVADVGRRVPAEGGVAKSIQVLGTNNTSISLDFVCIIVFERKIKFNIASSELLRI